MATATLHRLWILNPAGGLRDRRIVGETMGSTVNLASPGRPAPGDNAVSEAAGTVPSS